MTLFYLRKIKRGLKKFKEANMKKKNSPKLEIVWEQIFPRDAESRIQRAFEILMTTIDRDSGAPYAESDEKQSANSQGNGQEVATLSAVNFAILESEKTERSQNGRRSNFSLENSKRRNSKISKPLLQ